MCLEDRPDEIIAWTESAEISHIQWLSEFEEKVWPVYETYGFTFPQAVMVYEMNRLINKIREDD